MVLTSEYICPSIYKDVICRCIRFYNCVSFPLLHIIAVKVFDLQTMTWSTLKTYGKPPVIFFSFFVCCSFVYDTHVTQKRQPIKNTAVSNGFFSNDTCHVSFQQVSRGGQSVTLVGTTLVIFGGENANRTLLNDVHILDLETMTWDDMEAT